MKTSISIEATVNGSEASVDQDAPRAPHMPFYRQKIEELRSADKWTRRFGEKQGMGQVAAWPEGNPASALRLGKG